MTGSVPRPRVHEPLPTFAGTPPFPKAATTALADEQLRRNLHRATTTIRTKRARAIAERDDWEELRLAGAAIKDDVLARLPELLVELEANVTAAGGVVHWARDAAEANAIVAGIVTTAGATEVVKVKSMVTQEIELNEALAREGIAAWETDLAELIVQLGHDLPSHILVPAIHRNRTEVRDIFRREMAAAGRPAPADLTDDPRALAEAARLHLREKFLRAKVAISGANFAVAETGTVMVVESEGNGRMCLTLPDTLITVMGIEKLAADLARPRGLPPAPAALVDRRADEPVHLDVDRRHAGRRPAGVPPRPARQRPDRHPVRSGRAPGAPLHQVLGLPQRLPGLRAGRRTGVRVALPGPDRRDPDAAAPRHRAPPGRRADGVAAVRLVPVRRLLRGLSGPDRHPGGPGAPPGPGRAAARLASPDVQPGGRDDGRARRHLCKSAPTGRRRAVGRSRRPFPRAQGPDRAAAVAWIAGGMVSLARSPGPGADIVPAMVGGAGEDAPMTARDDAPAAERGDSMAAREDILARIGLALADHAPTEDVPRAYQTSTPADVDLVGLFAERVADYRATVHRCRPAVLAATIGTALAARVARRIVVPAGLDRAWLSEAQVEWIEDTPPLTHAELDGLDGVITACAVAIAETGTIVLDAGPDQGRRALSLLPDYHLCVVRADQIVGGVPEALPASRPAPPADLDQRPVGHERHRARARRGRPRSSNPRSRDRRTRRADPAISPEETSSRAGTRAIPRVERDPDIDRRCRRARRGDRRR